MKMFTTSWVLLILLTVNQAFAQQFKDNPNLDQIPRYLRERAAQQVTDAPLSSIVTINNWDNFSLAVDFGENNMAENPNNPAQYFTAYNTNAAHHTENGFEWFNSAPNFGASMQGDPVVAYDSIGNLYYENMYGSSIAGCKTIVSTNNGSTWGTSVTSIAGNDKNWIACDQTSGPYANYAYSTMTNNTAGNFTRTTDHGATWTSTFAPSTQSLPGMMVAVGPNGNTQGGNVYVVTDGGNSFSATYTFYLSQDGGATFAQKSSQNFANYVGTNVGGRNSVSNMRTRPYPMIAADNSYGPNRGKFYCVYASNFPSGNANKSDVWCRSSTDGGSTWTSAVRVNDDVNTENFQQWHPAIWCDKQTGRLYVMWMDTRDTPTNDSAYIYASYSDDGGNTFVANQRISNKKMKIDCASCGGGGTPRYEGDYNGVISNKKGSMIGWTDFRSGTFQSMTAYFPDFAMAIDHDKDTLYTSADNATFIVSIPEVKLYSDSVLLSAEISPVPTAGTISFEFPSGNLITTVPGGSKPVKVILSGSVPQGNYSARFIAKGPNGTPAHLRTAIIKVLPGANFLATASADPAAICQGQTSQLNTAVVGGTAPYTYAWTPSAGLSDPTLPNPVATPSATTTYHIMVTDNAAHTSTDSIKVTVNTPPAAPGPITGNQTVCAGDTVDYSVFEVPGSTSYSWSVNPPADSIIGNGSSAVKIIWGQSSGTIQVLAGNDCGNNPVPSLLNVTVNKPPMDIDQLLGTDNACAGAAAGFFLHLLGPETDTYTWTVPADATITAGQGTLQISVTWGSTAGTVTVFGSNNCGTTPLKSKNVGILNLPGAAGTISGQDTVCNNSTLHVFTVPEIQGATTYEWTLPTGVTAITGEGTNSITLLFSATSQSGNLSVVGNNTCGSGTQSSKAVVVKNCTGIGDKDLASSVKIFPNPVSNMLTVSISGKEQHLLLTLTSASGTVVYTERLSNIPADFSKKLDMSGYARGVYFLKLSEGTREYTEKVIVQ